MAIYHQVQQRSREWFQLRLGLPTASEFKRIITPKKLELSEQRHDYMNRLLAEWILGEEIQSQVDTQYMQRGREEEEAARKAFEFQMELPVSQIGFVTSDDGVMGCSPDGLVGDDAGLELKVPSAQVHLGYMVSKQALIDEYLLQLQGSIAITGRQRWYAMSYHPKLPPVIVTVERDEQVSNKIDTVVHAFSGQMTALRMRLEMQYGPFIREEPKSNDLGGLGITDEMAAWFESDARFQ